MSNLKYKLLLCVVVVMALAIPLYATDVVVYSENFDAAAAVPDGWSISAGSDWEVAPPQGGAFDPPAAASGANVLGYQLDAPGLYANGISSFKYARTPAIDCSDQVGVKLTFKRWLTVEDFLKDQATVEVSNDNANWHQVYKNPSSGDIDAPLNTVDTAWRTLVYDISEWADGQATVYVRWGLKTNADGQMGGWNVDDIEVTASGPTAFFTPTMTPDAGIWIETAAPIVGASGNGDPLIGMDPDTLAPGATTIWETGNGSNYLTPMDAQYLTSDDFDATGMNGVAVRFDRWLEVADGAYDRASIEVQVDPKPSTAQYEDVEIASDDTAVSLAETDSHVYEIDTTDMYDVNLTVDYDTDNMATDLSDHFIVEVSPTGADGTWTNVLDITASTPDDTNDGVVTSPVLQTPLGCDNGTLFIRVSMDAAADSGTVTVSNVTVNGQNWVTAWVNPSSSPVLSNVLDTKWTEQIVALPGADGAAKVRFRFGMGPTGDFPGYGGWSIGNIAVVEGSREFRAAGFDGPTALKWGATGGATVSMQNTGTGTWDDSFAAYEVTALNSEVVIDPANPDAVKSVPAIQDFAIDRWGVADAAVDGTVGPDDIAEFSVTLTAPPLSSIVYKTPVGPTAAPDAALSALGCDWAMGNETDVLAPLPSYMNEGPLTGSVVVTRFPDDQPGTDGAWARPQIEELAGAVPFVVQGFGDGSYQPLITVDRSAIAVYIQRAAQVPSSGVAPGTMFRDVPSDWWAVNQIQACAEVGIVSGYGDDTYQPTVLVTRDQMCKFIVNGVDYAIDGVVGNDLSVPDPDTLTPDAYPFTDVALDDPATTTVSEANPLAGFILAAYNADIVQGYPIVPPATKPEFRPGLTITRDQLAVFVWRGFLRDYASVVALGGPDFTQAIASDEISGDNEAPYSGLASLTGTVQAGDDVVAYVTFDAVRLNGSSDMTVLFDGVSPTGPISVVVDAAQIQGWVDQITATDPDTDTDGEPYKTIAVPIDTNALIHGTYEMTVSVDGAAIARKPVLKVMGQKMLEDFTSGVPSSWEVTGTPSTVDGSGGVMTMTGAQAIEFGEPTDGWHDIQVNVDVTKNADVADDDTVTILWSKDGGATWTQAGSVTGAALSEDEATTLSFDLPNGNPDVTPAVIGADDNPNFMVKIAVDLSTDAEVYVDNVEIRGT
jgi:hypothetical protein